jgi:hypothetical protein
LAYIPNIGSLVANTTSKLLSAEDVPLFLPSSLSPNLQNTLGFLKALEYEIQLRIAQADDALADIRHHLRIISGLWQFKKVNISGTGNQPNTRMRALFNRFNHRMRQSVLRYRAARSALLSANLKGEHWEDRLQNLKDSDVCGPGKDDFYFEEPGKANYGASKGRHEISWIWLVPRSNSEIETNSSEKVFDEGLRLEWSKSHARKIQQGISAYSRKQAYYCECMAGSFARAWLPFLQSEGIKPEWEQRYGALISAGKDISTGAVDLEKKTGEDGEEANDGEKEKYDAFELDD